MSTFDGIVDEFPNIRIDHFRYHPGKPPPAACFLSHVHSDHLQGLETLKMPFVYCSTVTKRILLRMEKYPHRINFAKGILEARKQTYRSLRLVLRPLPLETPVEIELGPKSKIRVTLFDANHCPGAVMFLIEGSDKSILYTGDVRAEPWWVNSILRNPVLLPYSCRARQLDCIYLDTTFASRDDIYDHFPTKADGLRELLTKVSKCPKTSTFYFRSWTLGYEDVWIALSNYLRSSIHVDAYQLRIFKSLVDETNPADRGPALAGFSFGNQQQLGCLTDDTAVSIHSCEPGTDCYDRLKRKKHVVWITPIVSRLKNGIEIAEIGAGGGGGDLYQIPELEIIDQATFEALQTLCATNTKHSKGLAKLGEALATARTKGKTNVSLEGLELDQDEEISLKQFVRLISNTDETNHRSAQPPQQRIVHFPYSRHSSYSELRHLISSFQPRDVCPCTVDIDGWTEETSIQALFGDLCSERAFRHDQKIRNRAEQRRETRGQKRKRETIEVDSQQTESQDSICTDGIYRSAQTSPRKQEASHSKVQEGQIPSSVEEPQIHIPRPARLLQKALSERYSGTSRVNNLETRHILPERSGITTTANSTRSSQLKFTNEEKELTASKDAVSASVSTNNMDTNSDVDTEDDSDSISSIATSTFESQSQSHDHIPSTAEKTESHTSRPKPRVKHNLRSKTRKQPGQYPISGSFTVTTTANSNTPTAQTLRSAHRPSSHVNTKPKPKDTRISSRRAAYRAAKSALVNNDHEPWSDLRLRSVGFKGHTEEEVEL